MFVCEKSNHIRAFYHTTHEVAGTQLKFIYRSKMWNDTSNETLARHVIDLDKHKFKRKYKQKYLKNKRREKKNIKKYTCESLFPCVCVCVCMYKRHSSVKKVLILFLTYFFSFYYLSQAVSMFIQCHCMYVCYV